MIDLDNLAKLLAAATRGEWGPSGVDDDEFDGCVYARSEHGSDGICQFARDEDAAHIVAIHNAAPGLLAELKEARAELAAMDRNEEEYRKRIVTLDQRVSEGWNRIESQERELQAARKVISVLRKDMPLAVSLAVPPEVFDALDEYDAAVKP